MTEEQINIAVAESLGCKDCHALGGLPCGIYPNEREHRALKKYTASLDACAEFEKTIKSDRRKWQRYLSALGRLCGVKSIRCDGDDYPDFSVAVDASALQRCEAYLRAIEKWEASA